jgi:hypothetical protein
MVQIWVSQSALQGLYHRPPCTKGTDREGCTGKDDCRNDLDPADQTCLNCVFDLLKPVLGLFTRQLDISKTSNWDQLWLSHPR